MSIIITLSIILAIALTLTIIGTLRLAVKVLEDARHCEKEVKNNLVRFRLDTNIYK